MHSQDRIRWRLASQLGRPHGRVCGNNSAASPQRSLRAGSIAAGPLAAGLPADASNPITVVCISDTHQTQPQFPDGDPLLHAGDLTNQGSFEELQAQLDWLASLPHRHKVVIAGNHDKLLDADYLARFPERICEPEGQSVGDLEWHDLVYLNNSFETLGFANGRRLSIFGSLWTPQFDTFAFQYPRIRDVWTGAVPEGAHVLLTHGPPKGYLDLDGKGCPNLTREVARTQPRVVVFGHIHAGPGREEVGYRGVERAYQRVMAGDGGLEVVLGMVFWLLGAWAEELVSSVLGHGEERRGARTTMVNAAVVGGLRNEERRPVIVLEI
ncbi:Uncharacterized protein TCAP_05125 [Tolypocladium capitatum]|uniref:Calcineurin-like phosphoesterase domain-containing protein n=1 Tax=Tolypocladium capitatum TaxID=45235 RepID=A0A2K3QBN1_9HYPO|nr:Uncharacterized protein TCAP_05125 [Tolypocladium capitatum]